MTRDLALPFVLPTNKITNVPLTRRQHILYHLREKIMLGELAPSQQIKEAEIATEMGSSATPLREALVELASEGLVIIEPNKRKRVAPLVIDEMVHLLKVKMILWRAGLEWGGPRFTADDVAQMDHCLEKYAQALTSGSLLDTQAAAYGYQSVIMLASGNPELDRITLYRLGLVIRFQILCMPDTISGGWLAHYQGIRNALAKGDWQVALAIHDLMTAEVIKAAEQVRHG